jgi:hypothetical protein
MRRLRVAIAVGIVAAVGCALVQDFDHYTGGTPDTGLDTGVVKDAPPMKEGGAPIVEEDVGPLPDVTPVDISVDTYEPPTDTGSPCPTGQVRCGETCRDINNDRDHCGPTCASCEAQGFKGAARCVAGSCQCATGATKCGDTCTYTDIDPINCGSCDSKVSDSSETCRGRSAVCAWKLKPCVNWDFVWNGTTYYVKCPTSSDCIDTASEANFCFEYTSSGSIYWKRRCYDAPDIGWCINNYCEYASSTEPNPCTAIPGRIECPVVTSPTDAYKRVRSCVDKLHDPNHCGGCNLKCAGLDELCADGSCKKYRPAKDPKDCAAGWVYCSPAGFSNAVCIYGSACPT